nr:CARDB domain-containing protein [Chitinophagaceae bacterium]
LPENGAPRMSVDFNQDFILDLIDKRVSMLPDDVNDLNTQDGKKYYMDITGLQPGIPIQSYVSPYLINCNYFGPFTNSPQVLTSPNLSILAQDITFSNYTPGISSPITVSANIKNESDFQATNFTVKLVNMFDTSISYPLNTVSFVPAHSNTSVSWNITTPAIASLCPMKVIIDYNNTIIETNEFDNVAIRGFANGGGSAQGGISVTTQVSPTTVYISPGQTGTVNLTGQATYTGLANPLINASVSGAEVACTIVETGQTFIGNTDAQGNFSVPITTPVGFGMYHISGTVYDFTWTGSFSGTNNQFEVIDAVVVQGSNLPQLQPSVNVTASSLLIGNSITVNYAASNVGTADATSPFKTKLFITGPSNFLMIDSFTTSLLNMGSTSTAVTLTTGIINTPGTYYTTVITDVDESITESAETDNTQTIAITVLAPEVDLVPEVANTPLVVCNPQIVVSSSIHNAGSVPSNISQAVIRLKKNGLVIDTALIPVAVINANESFPITHTFTPVFSQHNFTIEVVADRFNFNIESSELNNMSTVQLFVDTCKPDLKMADECQAVSMTALNNDYTGPVTLSALITNIGDRKLQQALTVRFDFMNGTFYDQVLNTPLDVNNSITVQTTIPSMPVGATQVKVIIDPINAVVEKNETDNESSIKALGRDYSPSSTGCIATIPQYAYHVGGFFHIYSPILSNALFKSDSLLVNFSISGPGINGIQNLGDAKMYNVNPTCVCPAVASIPTVHLISQQGTYHIYVTTDPNNDILETNETNNILDIEVLVQDKADMVMTSSYINPSNLNPIAGQSITTQVTYENIGNENLSDNMKLKLIIDNVVVDSISNASGLIQYGKATVNFTTPWSSIQPGVHLIRAIIDADNIIDELNETNNESVRPIIVGDAANMHFASLTASHLYPSLNDSITIMANVANNGALNCSSQVNFYFTNNLNDTIAFKSIPVTVLGNSNVPISFKWGVLDEQTTIVAVIKNSSTQEFDYTDNDSSFQLGKMKLIFEAEPACLSGNIGTLYAGILGGNAPYTYQWSTGTSGNILQDTAGSYSVIVTDATGQTSSGESSIMGCLATVQLKCFLQGYYLGSSSMAEVLFNQGRINLHTHTDTVTVELRNATTLAVEYSVNGILKTNGSMKAFFPLEALGNTYYVVVKHRNSMETWSALPLSITTLTPYDFTTAANKAYGDNQLEIEPGVFALFTGDVNQDGFIDSFDFPALDNDIFNGVNIEYVNTDLNGDGFVDSFDFPIFDTNSYNGVSVIAP